MTTSSSTEIPIGPEEPRRDIPLMRPEEEQPNPPAPPLTSWQCDEMATYYLNMANWLRARGL